MFMEPGTMGTIGFFSENGALCGLGFGSDATTEHECGIRPLWKTFGVVTDGRYGLEKRTVGHVPTEQVVWMRLGEDEGVLVVGFGPNITFEAVQHALRYRRDWETEQQRDLACAWSDRGFGIRARGTDYKHLVTIKEALLRGDCAFGILPQTAFSVLIPSNWPKDRARQWAAKEQEEDRKHQGHLQLWQASGVQEAMKAAGLSAFSVGRTFSEGEDGVLRTWLNPMEQRIYNAGWFTFDQLLAWARGEGPVVKKERTR